jgi:predicted ferric reductase
MKEKLKTVGVFQNTVVEDSTLVESSYEEDKVVVGSSGEFFLYYVAVHAKLKELSPSEAVLFTYCCMECDRNNWINLSKDLREICSKESGLAIQTIKNSLAVLVKKDLLLKKSERGGNYMVNPRYLTKQGTKARKKLLKFVLEEELEKNGK